MDIPVLVSQSFEKLPEIERAIETINREQTYFRLSLVTVDWIPDGGNKKWIDQYRLFPEIEKRLGNEPACVIVQNPLKMDFFSDGKPSIYIFSTADWTTKYAPPPVEIYLIYMLACGLVDVACQLPEEAGDSALHDPPIGCISDYNSDKKSIRFSMINPHICEACKNMLRAHGLQEQAIDSTEHILSFVRAEMKRVMTPSAFLSYSWDDDAHKEWVRTLAERLRADGVDVTLDRWATVPGDQLPAFMERAIRDNQFSVIVCTPRYKSRSDARKGGVGYEGDIMTAEVMTQQNNRKFIPVLRSGTWPQAAPSWLAGKYYINLSGDPYSERDYEDLVRTLLGIRETAPPIGAPMATIGANKNPKPEAPHGGADADFEDIKITRVLVEEVTEPRNDGTRGSALYAVPFALSRRPPSEWAEMFIASWNHPPQFTAMHRPGIARIHGATVTLDGTTIEEVEQYHRDTLQLAVAEANRQYREGTHKQEQRRAREQAQREEHKKQLDGASKRIKFD